MTAIYCKDGEFHSDRACTDPVQNFLISGAGVVPEVSLLWEEGALEKVRALGAWGRRGLRLGARLNAPSGGNRNRQRCVTQFFQEWLQKEAHRSYSETL